MSEMFAWVIPFVLVVGAYLVGLFQGRATDRLELLQQVDALHREAAHYAGLAAVNEALLRRETRLTKEHDDDLSF